jgi:aspartate carbamoyltransferase catalytic subunit
VSDHTARRISRVDDLTDDEVAGVLARAGEFADGAEPEQRRGIIGLAFFEASLRTRTGFSAAAYRLGLDVILVDERRVSAVSMPESLSDSVRTLSGYVDALIVRAPRPSHELAAAARADVPWLNAGDRGDGAEHPSQALIDLFAIERPLGPIGGQHVAVVGDLRMRSATSLLALLARRRPRALSLVTHDSLEDGLRLPSALDQVAVRRGRGDLGDVSAVLAVGIPHGAADERVRRELRIDSAMLAAMSPDAVVLSPMPVIDEIATPARRDPRMRFFEQSDLALFVRMALLELLLDRPR